MLHNFVETCFDEADCYGPLWMIDAVRWMRHIAQLPSLPRHLCQLPDLPRAGCVWVLVLDLSCVRTMMHVPY